MKYINGAAVLPRELLNEIRKYAEGVYIYIPKDDLKRNEWGENTNYRREMELRNLHIYNKYLEGNGVTILAECYHLSVKSIRRIILVQKRKMEQGTIMVKEILKAWNMDNQPVQIYHTAWSVDNRYVIKEYDNSNNMLRNIEMMKILFQAGIPVPSIISLPNGRDYLEQDNKLYILTTKLDGKNIVNMDQCSDKWFFEFGTILARLHIVFKECEAKINFRNKSLLEEMNGWVWRNLQQFNPEYLSEHDIKQSISDLGQVYENLPKQLIHRDVHLGNFLFHNGALSGYIDFDLSQINVRVFDLCYFLLGLLMEEDNNKVQKERWYNIAGQVIQGYDTLLPLNHIENQSIVCVMKNIELLFTAYFLGVGDEKKAKDSADLFRFVCENKKKILDVII